MLAGEPGIGKTRTAEELTAGLSDAFGRHGIAVTINRAGSLFSVFFTEGPVRDYAGARAADHERYARFFHHMLDRGVYLPPSGYELWTLSTTHGPDEVAKTIEAAARFND